MLWPAPQETRWLTTVWARTLAERGQIGEAMAQFEKVLEIDPEDELAHSNLGIALAVRGELDEAIAHF